MKQNFGFVAAVQAGRRITHDVKMVLDKTPGYVLNVKSG